VLWRALAEVAEKTVRKGAQVYIVGKIKTRSYVDKEGNNKYITEILGDAMLVLEKKQGTGPAASPQVHEADQRGNEAQKSADSRGKAASAEIGNSYDKELPGSDTIGEPPRTSYPFDEGIPSGKNEDDLPF
jgi:single-strand DNA-binding protein